MNKFNVGDMVKVPGAFGRQFFGNKAYKVVNFTKDDNGYLYKIDACMSGWLREDWLVAA